MILKRLADFFFNRNPYKAKDVRVIQNTLACWDDNEKKWVKILDNLPYSFGKSSVTVIYMTGSKFGSIRLLFCLLFRDNAGWQQEVHPVLVYSNKDQSLFFEQVHSREDLIGYVGKRNFKRIYSLSRLNWRMCYIK